MHAGTALQAQAADGGSGWCCVALERHLCAFIDRAAAENIVAGVQVAALKELAATVCAGEKDQAGEQDIGVPKVHQAFRSRSAVLQRQQAPEGANF